MFKSMQELITKVDNFMVKLILKQNTSLIKTYSMS